MIANTRFASSLSTNMHAAGVLHWMGCCFVFRNQPHLTILECHLQMNRIEIKTFLMPLVACCLLFND